MLIRLFVALALLIVVLTLGACNTTPTAVPSLTPSPTVVTSPTNTLSPSPSFTPTALPPPNRTFTPLPPSPTRTLTITPPPTKPASEHYASAFGIDYAHPAKYLAQGEQTRLSNPSVIDALRNKPQSIAHLGEIYFWIKREFATWSAGGATIGVVTTDQLFNERRLGGCHDWGLVYASIARELGYPTVMIDTAGISWAQRYRAGEKIQYLGHVFVEVFVANQWVLIDSTNNWYVADNYNSADGIIPLKMGDETEGLFVMRKGMDTWGYGIHSNAELQQLMNESARLFRREMVRFPPYTFLRFR